MHSNNCLKTSYIKNNVVFFVQDNHTGVHDVFIHLQIDLNVILRSANCFVFLNYFTKKIGLCTSNIGYICSVHRGLNKDFSSVLEYIDKQPPMLLSLQMFVVYLVQRMTVLSEMPMAIILYMKKCMKQGIFFSNDSFLLNIVKPLSVLAGAPDSSG